MKTMFERIKKWWRGYLKSEGNYMAKHWRKYDFIWMGVGGFLFVLGSLKESILVMAIGIFLAWTGRVYYWYDETIERIGVSKRFWREYFIPTKPNKAKNKEMRP